MSAEEHYCTPCAVDAIAIMNMSWRQFEDGAGSGNLMIAGESRGGYGRLVWQGTPMCLSHAIEFVKIWR